ncbi:hypothetical protein INR49_014230 [Caranx melampygus]|nr:hypothetical protein INR49_014230 [Caranx melampygus]
MCRGYKRDIKRPSGELQQSERADNSSCKNNRPLTRPKKKMAASGNHEGKPTGKQEPEIPITIVMSSDLLFKKQQGSSSMTRGPAFSFVKALQAVNAEHRKVGSNEFFVVKLIQDKSDDQINTFSREHNLGDIITPLIVEDSDLIGALQENRTHLYLSTPDGSKVTEVINLGIAAAEMYTPEKITEAPDTQLRVVFDGDAVLFSNESELVFKQQGLQGYMDHEREHVNKAMSQGPFREFMETLVRLQGKFGEKNNPIRTYLVTSRDAGSAGFRALNTLRTWGVEISEAYFLSGPPKAPCLRSSALTSFLMISYVTYRLQ